MAPPKIRRTGHSKRAQLGAFTGYLAASAGVLIGLVFLIVQISDPERFADVRSETTDVVGPAGTAGSLARNGAEGFVESIAAYYRAGTQNARLRYEVDEAHVKLAESEALATENRQLKALLKLAEAERRPVAYARLIGSTSSSVRRLAWISVGSGDGVVPGMPVRTPLGLIGRVLEVGDSTARVLLLTDSASIVPVRRAQDNVAGLTEGLADGTLRIRLNNLGINPLKPGDVFVTSGAGGIYPPGIAVAVVAKVNRDGAIARVLANPAATPYVAVDPVWQSEAVEAVEEIAQPPADAGQ
jgi:rod shape-determining protein MreC